MREPALVDLRSDTVTRPTASMRRAMAEAEVGDDVYREDPTVNRLEERAAAMFAKQAALFVPSGTMGNTIAVKLHTEPGQEVICEAKAHIVTYELSMLAWFSGCLARTIPTAHGILAWEQIQREIRPVAPFWAPTGLIEIENTHNMAGGTIYPVEAVDEICHQAHALRLKVHMDGARIFNAAAALHVSVARIAAHVDTVMFCLSKGLAAPVGSILVGSRDDMDRARLHRKRLGGGMRQAGVLAAAALVAIGEMTERLVEDHANAGFLAEELANISGISLDPRRVETNIVIFDVSGTGLTAADFSACLKSHGILMSPVSATEIRAVTHCDVTRRDCERALRAIKETARSTTASA
ncbi:MAG: aminotransferase class V-fold PLP-dependent enzyme [Bryobacteraceae bacterium]|nr:aminotransferase class V-fold PLP-dependent enzyme [Bryobacterales bacterium]NUN01892.1 aminotransferase class V-fold PLP-dependent enzyme [Bryobacteraceae bacterium]